MVDYEGAATATVTAADWMKGIGLSVTASIIGGASKLAIRKSWLLQKQIEEEDLVQNNIISNNNNNDIIIIDDDDNDDNVIIESDIILQRRRRRRNIVVRTIMSRTTTTTTSDDDISHVHSLLPQSSPPASPKRGGRCSDNNNNSNKQREHLDTEETADTSTSVEYGDDSHTNDDNSNNNNSNFCLDNDNDDVHHDHDVVGNDDNDYDHNNDDNNSIRSHSNSTITNSGLLLYDPESRRPFRSCNVCCNNYIIPYCLRFSGMIGMTILNPLCCVLAMNYASPSILAPFSGLTLVWIVLLSGPILNERPKYKQICAAVLIILGEVIVAVFGDHTNDNGITIHAVRESYRHVPFLLFIASAASWFLLLTYWILYAKSSSVKRFAWGVSGGSLTGFQNFLKDSLTILKAHHDYEHSASYYALLGTLIFMAAFTAFSGLLLLTACMKRYDATYSSTMFVGSFVIAASIMSAVHYDTFQHINDVYLNLFMYPTGLGILIIGVYLLSTDNNNEHDDDDNNNTENIIIDNEYHPEQQQQQCSVDNDVNNNLNHSTSNLSHRSTKNIIDLSIDVSLGENNDHHKVG